MQTKNTNTQTFPPKYDDCIGIRIDRATKEKLKQLAQKDHRTISSYLQVLLWDHVANVDSSSKTNKESPPGHQQGGQRE